MNAMNLIPCMIVMTTLRVQKRLDLISVIVKKALVVMGNLAKVGEYPAIMSQPTTNHATGVLDLLTQIQQRTLGSCCSR